MDDSLYQQTLLDLARSADGAGSPAEPQVSATVDNPVCGDRVTIELSVEGDRVAEIGHTVRGCVLCGATAAIIGRHARGMPADRLGRLREEFEAMIRDGGPTPEAWPEFAAFEPVRTARSRHECVLLPFAALAEALAKTAEG